MPTSADPNNRWFSIYVPEVTSGQTITTYESFLRVGSPDTTTESGFTNALRANYAAAAAQPAVEAAFGNTPTGGIVLYTKGDLVQFVNGRSDTRVLNDAYIVHVLNKATVDTAGAAGATAPVKTYRSYLRLGAPHDDIEKPMTGAVADAQLAGFVTGLAPAAPATLLDPAGKQAQIEAVLGGPAPAANQPAPDPAVVTAAVKAARTQLLSLAQAGDPAAIQALDDLRVSSDARAAVTYDGQTAKAWGLAALTGLHLQFANKRRDQALAGDTAARTKLQSAAAGPPPNPLARRKLVELMTSSSAAAAQSQGGQPAARDWAKGVLAALPAGDELSARFSLGAGVALYADQPVTITTPSALKVTTGSDSRSVLGPTYAETYDVSDATIAQIKDGWITQANQIPDKKLITASLTQRDASGLSWRTTKFDQSKALSYSLSDSGSFGISSSYAFSFGLKLTNGISGSFDGSLGVSVSVPSSFKAELGKKRLETSWTGGKIAYSKDQSLTGSTVKLAVDKVEDFVVSPARETLVAVMRGGMIAVNALLLAYTAAVAGIGNAHSGEGEEETAHVKAILKAGEPVYIAVSVLNAVFMAAGLIVSVIQLMSKMTVGAAQAASPAQQPNIVLNSAGIKLQCGPSFISLDPSGIAIFGPQVYVAGPFTNVMPAYLTGNLTPAGIAEAVALAEEGILVMDIFGDLLI